MALNWLKNSGTVEENCMHLIKRCLPTRGQCQLTDFHTLKIITALVTREICELQCAALHLFMRAQMEEEEQAAVSKQTIDLSEKIPEKLNL